MNPCIAHRGWSGIAPENTLAAVQLAIQNPITDTIEIDVQLSKDGVPVIIHDYTLDRTTSGSGFVKEHTLEQLKQLDASYRFPPFQGERIPTLEEVLQLCKDRVNVNIELKTAGQIYPDIAEKVGQIITTHQMENQIVVTSFDHHAVKKVKAYFPKISTGLIVSGNPLLLFEQLEEAQASMLSIRYTDLYPEFVQEILHRGYALTAWTVDRPEDMQRLMLIDSRIGITTNHLQHFEQVLREVLSEQEK